MDMKKVWVSDGFCTAVFLFIMVFIFVLPAGMQETIAPVFRIVYRTDSAE